MGVKYRLTVLVCDLLLCQQRMEPPPENGLEDGQDDEPPRVGNVPLVGFWVFFLFKDSSG